MDCSTPAFPVLHYLPEFCSNSCPLSWWCHPIISFSVTPPLALYLSQHQGLFQSQLFTSGVQSIGAKRLQKLLRLLPLREKCLCWFPMNLGALVTASISHSEIPKATAKKTMLFQPELLVTLALGIFSLWLSPLGWEKSRQQERALCRHSSWSFSWVQPSRHPSPDAWHVSEVASEWFQASHNENHPPPLASAY